MVRLIDYNKAYKSLWEARQIAEELHDDSSLAAIYVNLANLYCVSPGDRTRLDRKAEESLLKAAEAAIRSNNMEYLPMISMNLAVWSFPRKSWGSLGPVVETIRTNYKDDRQLKVVYLVMEACDRYFNGETDKAEELLNRARGELQVKRFAERYYYSIDLILADLYLDTRQYDKGIELLTSDMQLAQDNDHTDFLISIYEELSKLYAGAGNQEMAEEYKGKFLKLKDEFDDNTGLANLEGLDFLSQIDSINAQVERLSLERRESERRTIIIGAVLAVVIILLVAMTWIYLNLKRNHRNLYERNREMLEREEQHRLLRQQWEEERRLLIEGKGAHDDEPETTIQNAPGEERDYLRNLYTRILKLMDESTDIYNLGFTIANLAAMVGRPARDISKAINVCYGGNFHQLLNKYRLREAARLMHICSRSTNTIEGIAERAGFRSRTSFATLFKKTIGITPSEYWRLARESASDGVALPE